MYRLAGKLPAGCSNLLVVRPTSLEAVHRFISKRKVYLPFESAH